MDKEKKHLEEDASFTIAEIKELMAEVHRNQIGRIKIKQGGYSIEIEGAQTASAVAAVPTAAPAVLPMSEAAPPPQPEGNQMKAPIVGTFYAAPSPDAPPFVKVGDAVKKGDTLFIIESMKLMNEVASDFDGTVSAIHVQNAEGVEYGQPIMTIV